MRKESGVVRFLYETGLGRCLLKVLVQPLFSRCAQAYLESTWSKWLIPLYIKKYSIYIGEYEKSSYSSFQDFFIRKRKQGFQRIDETPEHLISPCDGFLSVYPIKENQTYQVKHVRYDVRQLLKDSQLAEKFQGGTCLIFRLTPGNYHRYCYVDRGVKEQTAVIPGVLHCVRPIAYERYPVFVQNSREYTQYRSEQFGELVQMEVGALLVGKIHNNPGNETVLRGEEKGYFQFGGSTIILLLERGRIQLDKRVLKNMQRGRETKVRMGERIGVGKENT